MNPQVFNSTHCDVNPLTTVDAAQPDWRSATPEHIYRPVVFDRAKADDFLALQDLIRNQPFLIEVDTLEAQLRELVKIRHPGAKLSREQLQQRTRDHLGDRGVDEYGVQVYYPWANRLVRLLPEAEFVELRTNRNQHKITSAEQAILVTKKVGVIGLSVGQSVALTMAMERSLGEIRLADFDTLDVSNLNRLRCGLHNIGLPKAVIAAREIAEIDPFIRVVCFFDGVTETNLDTFLLGDGKLDLLIEESDGIDIKFRSRYRARELRIPVVMDTSDRGMLDIERFDLEPNRPLFHGLVGDVDPDSLRGLTVEEKLPYILDIVSPETMSCRMKASLIEIDQSISTWPQLASDVVLGGALAADAGRRILLDQIHVSGRFFVDIGDLIKDPVAPDETSAVSTDAETQLETRGSIERYLISYALPEVPQVSAEEVQRIIQAAVLAPSAANCQPWRWIWEHGALFLFHDRHRSHSPSLDFQHSASQVALGAAAENVHLMASELGLTTRQEIFPLGQDDALVSVFTIERNDPSTVPLHPFPELARSIEHRHTNRRIARRQPIPKVSLDAIREGAESIDGAKLLLISSDEELATAANMLAAVERLQLLQVESHRELMNEIRWTPEEAVRTGDGIDLDTVELTASERAGFMVAKDWSAMSLIASWGRGHGLGTMTRRAVAAAGAIGLITMPQRSPRDCLLGGRAVQRAWLMATRHKVGLQPIAPVTYLLASLLHGGRDGMSDLMVDGLSIVRAQYERLFGSPDTAAGILLFRLAVADQPIGRSARRPIADVFECGPNPLAMPPSNAKRVRARSGDIVDQIASHACMRSVS